MRQIISPLSGIRSPFGLRNGRFSPAVLFANNEPGVWYDPSQAANLDWRRNLLTFTEQFDNAAWTKSGVTVTANAATAPDGATTADTLEATTTITPNAGRDITTQAPQVVSGSCYFKAGSSNFAYIQVNGDAGGSLTASFVTVNLSSGEIGTVSALAGGGLVGASSSLTDVGDGWFRLTLSGGIGASNTRARLFVGVSGAQDSRTATIGNTVSVWGAQLEVGSTATEYQRISDVNTEVRERFPQATLFQDTAGTTPVTTPGQTVALMLDKSKGLTLGPELVTNGAGVAFRDNVNPTISYFPGVNVVADVTYAISFTISNNTGNSTASWRINGVGGRTTLASITGGFNGTITRYFSSTHSGLLSLSPDNLVVNFSISDVTVKELPGFHATQATTSWRPTYGIVPAGGRRNLLTHTEQFDNAAWVKQAGGAGSAPVVTPNAALAPDGTMTAERVVFTLPFGAAVGDFSQLIQNFTFGDANYAGSFYIKSNTGADQDIVLVIRNAQVATVTATTEWQRVSASALASAVTSNFGLRARGTFTADTVDLLVWGAQLEVGSTATAYQKVTTQFDVTEAGVESLGYLSFDGVDDFMITPTITPGIDKVQVFAGVRKLSDATEAMIVALGDPFVEPSTGTFEIRGPRGSGGANYNFRTKGSTTVAEQIRSPFAAPITNVLAAISDMSAPSVLLRVDGNEIAAVTTNPGAVNYGSNIITVGRRINEISYFNGHLHQLITRFGTNLEVAQIESAEAYVAGKTAGVDL
jgi:hypothetical protein